MKLGILPSILPYDRLDLGIYLTEIELNPAYVDR